MALCNFDLSMDYKSIETPTSILLGWIQAPWI